MSMTISRAEGVTVYTLQSDRKSKWPLLCQILHTLCCSPVCSVSRRIKQQLSCTLTALATVQIMVGIMNLGFGILASVYQINLSYLGSIFIWLGVTIVMIGIMCILAEKFPSPCLLVLSVMVNIGSAALAIANVVLYSVDLASGNYWISCDPPQRQNDLYSWSTPSPAKKAEQDEIFKRKLHDYTSCQENLSIFRFIHHGLDIMMIVLAVLHLCVSISWCVLAIKVLRKKKADDQYIEDPELCRPLMEEETPNAVF